MDWNRAKQQVTGTFLDQKLQMTIGQNTAYVNGVRTKLQIAPFIESGNTLVPLRFVAEATGLPVTWDSKARTIKIDREGAIDRASATVQSLYHIIEQAGTAKDLRAVMTAYHPKSPSYDKIQAEYREQFKYDLNVSADVLEVTVAGSTIHAYTNITLDRKSGPFTWDVTHHYEILVKQDASGAWKIYDQKHYETEYFAGDDLLEARPQVPETEQRALQEAVDTQYKGFNEENGPLLMSVIHPESVLYKMFQNSIAEGIFDEFTFMLKAESARTVYFQGDDAVIYMKESDTAGGEAIDSNSLYWLKKHQGKWLIYDVLGMK